MSNVSTDGKELGESGCESPSGIAAVLPVPENTGADDALAGALKRWTILLLAVGILLRLCRYSLRLTLNGDEARVALNIINRNYRDLLRPLDYQQVAPVGFLWSERAMYQSLGMSEFAMRLLPLCVGIAALCLFAVWARMLLKPMAAFIAVGVLAVAQFVVQHAVEVKPYGFDLLASICLLLPATLFLLRRQDRWLVLLAVLAPLTVALSYPIVFVAGAIGLTLALQARQMTWRSRALVAAYGIILAVSFLLVFLQISDGQYHRTTVVMNEYWSDAFPPAGIGHLLLWLADVHTGNLFAYPVGGKNGASAGSFLLSIVGIIAWFKSRRGPVIWLLLLPFLFTLLAAAMRRYPYGQSERCCQHLAPAIALLMGLGGATLIELLFRQVHKQREAARVILLAFLAIAVGVMITNALHPHTQDHIVSRQIAQTLLRESDRGATIAVLEPREGTSAIVQWYLSRDNRILWNAAGDKSWENKLGTIYVVTSRGEPALEDNLSRELGSHPQSHMSWQIAPIGDMEYWEVYKFVRQ